MRLCKQSLSVVLGVLSLLLIADFAVADIKDNTTNITISMPSGNVTGNSGIDNTVTDFINDPKIPQPGNDEHVYNNRVIIHGTGSVTGSAYGGFTYGHGNVYNNAVIVAINGHVGSAYGGITAGDGAATGNRVEINGTANTAFGGMANSNGDAIGNHAEISGVVDTVIGGCTVNKGHAISNSVEISGTVVTVYGGWAVATGTVLANVSGNTVTITSDGKATDVYGGRAYGDGDVTDNSVKISGSVLNDVHGGWASGDGDVRGNSVEISGSVTNQVYGGWVDGVGVAIDNIVKISGTVSGSVYGGWSDMGGDVAGNSIEISGSVSGDVYGGYVSGFGKVEDNSVKIYSTANLTNASLWGSNITSVAGTGNTLNVDGFSGDITAIGNFENYNFVLGRIGSNLTVINILGGTPVNIDNSNITISLSPDFVKNNLSAGDDIIIISSITNLNLDSSSVTIPQSPFITYDFTESRTSQLVLTIDRITLQPQTKALGEGFVAGLAFLGQAADVRSSIYFVPQGPRFIPFAKMIYGKQYISSGSNVTVKGFSAIAGLALNTNFDNGSQLVVGAFVEGGWGDYNSRNSFNNFSAVKGKGDTEYYGGGVLARYVLKSGLYGEGTLAAGKTETDFRSWDFAPSTHSKYDFSVPYYSAHVGIGQILNLTDMLNLDVYGKYLWTRQAGDNVTVNGYHFKFKDVDSHRVRMGGKLQADVSPQLQPYVGGAYEYEFSGKIKGSLYGMNLDKPSLRGSTGIGELGLVWSPNDAQNLKVDLGAQGYAGKREGVSGGLTVSMSF